MKHALIALIVTVAFGAGSLRGEDDIIKKEMKSDVILRALVEELDRNETGLKLEDLARPYFIELNLSDQRSVSLSATLGSIVGRDESHSRFLSPSIRVGSYELDNTNFSGNRFGGFGRFGGGGAGPTVIPVEDDYSAIRQAIWWATDRQYKSVVESFANKKAFMESKVIDDKPNDFTKVSPTVHFDKRSNLELDARSVERMITSLSRAFRDMPEVKSSVVMFNAAAASNYLVNTEGTRLRTSESRYSVSMSATVQAEDGMEFSDSRTVYARAVGDLPAESELSESARDMVNELIAVKNAPKLENYTGPVLFDAPAAASIVSTQIAGRFGGGQRPVGSRTDPNDLSNKLNRRILPRFMNVIDDPLNEKWEDNILLGHYKFDDEGVPAQPVQLVEKGRLKTLLMSRNPSEEIGESNGHGRKSFGAYVSQGVPGVLIFSSDDPSDDDALKQELIEACEDEGLEFGLRVASMSSSNRSAMSALGFNPMAFMGGFGMRGGISPLRMFKVYPNGREELVRAAEIGSIDQKAFKRMLAAGSDPFVLNRQGRGGTSIIAPSMLFEELDFAEVDRDFDKPPILESPLARTD